MRVIIFAITSLLISFTSINTFALEEDDFLLLALPAIIAGSQKTCEPSVANSCTYQGICEKFEGYWYWNRCNVEPLGLIMVRRLVGSWDFSYSYSLGTSGDVYTFFSNMITPYNDNSGDYKIVGNTECFDSFLPVTARYDFSDDILYIHQPGGICQSSLGETSKRADYWTMDFVNSTTLIGIHRAFANPFIPPDPASAIKR